MWPVPSLDAKLPIRLWLVMSAHVLSAVLVTTLQELTVLPALHLIVLHAQEMSVLLAK